MGALLWSQDGGSGVGGDDVAATNTTGGGRGGAEHRGGRPRGAGHGHAVRDARRPSSWWLPRVAGGAGAPAPGDVALEHLRGKQGAHFCTICPSSLLDVLVLICYTHCIGCEEENADVGLACVPLVVACNCSSGAKPHLLAALQAMQNAILGCWHMQVTMCCPCRSLFEV